MDPLDMFQVTFPTLDLTNVIRTQKPSISTPLSCKGVFPVTRPHYVVLKSPPGLPFTVFSSETPQEQGKVLDSGLDLW